MIYTDVGAGGVLGPRKFKSNVAATRDETLSIRSVSRTAGRAKKSWVPPPEESLGHLFPEAVAQWHPEQDCHPGLTAFTVRPGSGKSIRWRCEEHGHEWHVSPGDRTKKGRLSQCPKCHRMALGLSAEKTYLADTNPELRAEWHPLQDFHPDATIENTTTGSARAIRWRCVRGHEWHAAAKQRARGQGCDRCVDFPGPGESVAEHFPHLVDEWHPEQIRHRDATAENTKRGSRKRILWRCSDGHVWTARLNSRTGAAPSNCPTCERLRRGSSAERQYVCDFPDAQLVGEWHAVQAQAQGATPQNTTCGSKRPIRWRCSECGHDWYSPPLNRCGSQRSGCPRCDDESRRIAKPGRSLEERYPVVARDWDEERNGRTAATVNAHSGEMAWWRCDQCGHGWATVISARTVQEHGCFKCYWRAKPGDSLADRRPDLMDEYLPALNGGLLAEHVPWRSDKARNWKCGACKCQFTMPPSRRSRPDGSPATGCTWCSGHASYPTVSKVRDVISELPDAAALTRADRHAVLLPTGALGSRGQAAEVAWAYVVGDIAGADLGAFIRGEACSVDQLVLDAHYRGIYGTRPDVPRRVKRDVKERDGWVCQNPFCRTPDHRQRELARVDHKLSPLLGGHNTDLANLHCLCEPCNRRKNMTPWAEFLDQEAARCARRATQPRSSSICSHS